MTEAQTDFAESAKGTVGELAGAIGEATIATGAAGLVEQTLAVTFIPNLAENSVLVGTSLARPTTPAEASVTPMATLAPADASSDATAYLADLAQLIALVKKNDTADIADRYATFVTDDQTFFTSDLLPLNDQANAAFASTNAKGRTTLANFGNDLTLAINATTLANLQLAAWGSDPSTGNKAAVTAQFAKATAAVKTVERDAIAVRGILTGRTVPASLLIEETAVPDSAAAGSTQTFTVTVTNIGDSATDAGTITFANTDGGLVVQGDAQQALPALDAGASTTVSWQALVSAPANGDAKLAYQIAATAGTVQAALTDSVALT